MMNDWIIILIKQPEREYLAIRSKGIMPNTDINRKDGRVIKSGTFEVIVNDLTSKEALLFMALPTYAKDKILHEMQ